MFGGTRDNFATLNKILDQPHVQIGAVRKACWAVEDCIAQNRDNLRGFFDKCFPNLLKRIFGYDDFEASWLNIVTKSGKEDDARALVSLLSPTGRLMSAMFSADADQLIKYIFPVERLPAHTQELLKTHAGRCELEQWPQYRGHLVLNALGNPQTYLSVFEYFMFWTAFYVLRGGRSMRDGVTTSGGRGAGGLGLLGSAGHWGGLSADHLLSDIKYLTSDIRRMGSTLITGFHHGAHSTPLHTHPYYALLRAYLKYLIPRPTSLASPASSPHQDVSLEGSSKAEKAYAAPLNQLVLSILMEFWLTDASEPVPLDGLDLHQATGAKPVASPTVPAASTAASPPTASTAAATAAAAAAAVGSASTTGVRLPDGGGTPIAAAGAAVPATLRVLSYQPPPEELVEALTQLFRYIHVVDLPTWRGPHQQQQQPTVRPAQSGAEVPWLPEVPVRTITPMTASAAAAAAATAGGSTGRGPSSSPAVTLLAGPSASPAVQASSRKLYRFLRRTFAQWPLSSSASLMPIISLFLTILTPWAAPSAATAPTTTSPALAHALPSAKPTAGDASTSHRRGLGAASLPLGQAQPALGSTPSLQQQAWLESVAQFGSGITHRLHPHHHQQHSPQSQDQGHKVQHGYTPEWQHHVLTHLPFYCILVPQLLALAFARLSLQGDVAAAELLLLLRALQASGPQLMQELRSAERAYNGYLAAHKRRPEGPLADLLPWVAEQTLGFEAAAVAGAQPSMPMQVDTSFRLFTLGTSSAPHYGSAILRAAQAQVRPELREALADAMFAVLPITDVSADMQPPPEPPQLAAALRAYPRAGHWAQLHYKGDWLARPIASHEIGPLVRLLVWVSRWLNHALGLDVPWRGDDEEEEAENVVQDGLRWMRRKGFRISLRFLAEVQTLGWLLVASLLVSMMVSGFNQQPGPAPPPHTRPLP